MSFSIAPLMVSTLFDRTSIGFRLPRWRQWLKKKKKITCQCRRYKRRGFDPWVGNIPWSRKRQPASEFLPGKMSMHTPHEGLSMGFPIPVPSERNLLHKICMYVYVCVFVC